MLRYGVLLLRLGGPRLFFPQLKRQLYSKSTYYGLERDLATYVAPVSGKVQYSLKMASEKDMREVLLAAAESKKSVFELVKRIQFYECGFHDCYVARTMDSRELCFIAWLLFPKDGNLMSRILKNKLPSLKEDEVLLENSYTFEKYRGKSLFPSVVLELAELARVKGFKRMITYVEHNNMASLKGCQKAGFRKFEEVPELKILFYTRRKGPNWL